MRSVRKEFTDACIYLLGAIEKGNLFTAIQCHDRVSFLGKPYEDLRQYLRSLSEVLSRLTCSSVSSIRANCTSNQT